MTARGSFSAACKAPPFQTLGDKAESERRSSKYCKERFHPGFRGNHTSTIPIVDNLSNGFIPLRGMVFRLLTFSSYEPKDEVNPAEVYANHGRGCGGGAHGGMHGHYLSLAPLK